MDKPEQYNGQTQTGLYYVETSQYFPFRGNESYAYPLIKYGLEKELIKSEEIKYVIVSSLEVPSDYYNNFIDYLYSNVVHHLNNVLLFALVVHLINQKYFLLLVI